MRGTSRPRTCGGGLPGPVSQRASRRRLRLAERRRGDPYWAAMQAALAHGAAPDVSLRPARLADVDALADLERRAFRGDRISRRGFRRFARSPRAAPIVAEEDGGLGGHALVLFRGGGRISRPLSIAVAPP